MKAIMEPAVISFVNLAKAIYKTSKWQRNSMCHSSNFESHFDITSWPWEQGLEGEE